MADGRCSEAEGKFKKNKIIKIKNPSMVIKHEVLRQSPTTVAPESDVDQRGSVQPELSEERPPPAGRLVELQPKERRGRGRGRGGRRERKVDKGEERSPAFT